MQAPSPSALFQLLLDAPGTPHLEVVRFRGIERLSRCFSFDVTARLDAGAIDEATLAATLMERPASLRVPTSATEARAVNGVVTRVSVEGADGDGRAVVRVRIEPRLALLGEGRQSRIFQEQPLSGVLGAVLTEAGLPHRFSLAAPRPPLGVAAGVRERG
ncbi:contractile injection system protein, VgrG/Pvc8 family [Sorangium sp. So ce1000]|uniref:contractile injection system protein, VgrG/Pvc8 family n=1 Tax=Sorangium sp. So ce1000 TaxID=3133325 RepID=UPI003F6489B9